MITFLSGAYSSQGSPCRLQTDRQRTVAAEYVVVASHYPFIDRALLFPRVHPKRSYAIAGEIPGPLPEGMYIYRWSTQDGVSTDLLPYIGPYLPGRHVYVATAFRKWGLTNGTIGAKVITDSIAGLPNGLLRSIGDRVRHPQRGSFDDLAPGEAAVKDKSIAPTAAFRDAAGVLHKVSAVCTHLGCMVTWNRAERSENQSPRLG